jgi:hypothetical protein
MHFLIRIFCNKSHHVSQVPVHAKKKKLNEYIIQTEITLLANRARLAPSMKRCPDYLTIQFKLSANPYAQACNLPELTLQSRCVRKFYMAQISGNTLFAV